MNLTHDAGHRETRPAEHPGAADPVADTLDRWTLGPVKRCHEPTCLAPNYGKSPGHHAGPTHRPVASAIDQAVPLSVLAIRLAAAFRSGRAVADAD
jgi:hypothetical protein